MKKIFVVLILTCFVLHSHAQWTKQASGFTKRRFVNQIVPVSKTVVWASAYDNDANTSVLSGRDYTRTTDGGTTWTAGTVSAAPDSYNWSCIAAWDENTAWAMFYDAQIGSTGGIFKTADGGTTWSQQGAGLIYNTSGASFPDVINFWSADEGVAIGDPVNGEYEIYTTTDGGTTWNAVDGANIPDPLSGEFGITYTMAIYNDVIWFGTNAGRIYKSTDHGFTWNVYDTGFNSNWVQQLTFSDEDHGWIEMYDATGLFLGLYRTTDGGTTWTNITPSSNFFAFYGICYVPGKANTLVSSGFDPISFFAGSSYSYDGGDTWTNLDFGENHYAVSFLDSTTGWSGGINTGSSSGMWKFNGGLSACSAAPTATSTSDITAKAALLTWSSVAGASKYRVKYGSVNGTVTVYAGTNAYHVTGLTAGTTYSWKVKAYCGSGTSTSSGWSQSATFTTELLRVEDSELSSSFVVYPNPVSSAATISFSLDKESKVIANLFTIDGKKVLSIADQQFPSGANQITMNRGSLSSGVYILQLKTDEDLLTRKLSFQ